MSIRMLVIASNMLNERHQLEEWFAFVKRIADAGILIVDSGSNDGTVEYAKEQGAIVITSNIIQEEGYGPARNHLRQMSREHFPNAHWMCYLDGDERIDEEDFHQLRFLKDYTTAQFDVIGFPRIDWHDRERTYAHNDWRIACDWQARMTRLDSPLKYIRKLHEQLTDHKGVLTRITNPKINHFHRSVDREKRDFIGKLCAKLHMEDKEFGHTFPEHHKEAMYRERFLKEGL